MVTLPRTEVGRKFERERSMSCLKALDFLSGCFWMRFGEVNFGREISFSPRVSGEKDCSILKVYTPKLFKFCQRLGFLGRVGHWKPDHGSLTLNQLIKSRRSSAAKSYAALSSLQITQTIERFISSQFVGYLYNRVCPATDAIQPCNKSVIPFAQTLSAILIFIIGWARSTNKPANARGNRSNGRISQLIPFSLSRCCRIRCIST